MLLDPAIEPIPAPSSQNVEPIQAPNIQHVEPIQAPGSKNVEPIQALSHQQIRRSPFRGTLALILSPSLRDMPPTHEIVHVRSTSPPRHPYFFGSRQSNLNPSVITFSSLRIGGSAAPRQQSLAVTRSLCPEGSRMKLKKKITESSHSAAAGNLPQLLTKDLEAKPSTLALHSSPTNQRSPLKVSSPLRPHSSPTPIQSKPTASPLPFAADDSPVSRLEAFRTIMAQRPGTYGFNTWTQMDRVHQTSRETQTSPLPQVQPAQSQTSLVPTHYQVNSTLTLQDLRNELAVASLALVRAFGF